MSDYAAAWTAPNAEQAVWLTDSGHDGQAYWEWGKVLAGDVARYVPADGCVVDYGCGLGRVLRHIQAARRIGVDVSPSQVAYAAELSPGPEYLLGDGRSIPLPDGVAHLVYSFQVLQHVDASDVAAILAETVRVLAPGGVCYHTFASSGGSGWQPEARLPRAPSVNLTGPGAYCDAMACICYDETTIRQLAEQAGFATVEVTRTPDDRYLVLLGGKR